jgi:hypothetical protein
VNVGDPSEGGARGFDHVNVREINPGEGGASAPTLLHTTPAPTRYYKSVVNRLPSNALLQERGHLIAEQRF